MSDDENDPFFVDLLKGDLEYISYWAEVQPVPNEDGVFSVRERDKLRDVNGRQVGGVLVDINTILQGWEKLRRLEEHGGFAHCGAIGTRVTAIDVDRKFGGAEGLEYDRCIADAVVQMGLFGELRYGNYAPHDQEATRAVFEALFADAPDSFDSLGYNWSRCRSVGDYKKHAIRHLLDHSELSEWQLEAADWEEIFRHFTSE
ncbi:hypothetical protein [Actinomadura rubrisoli]|uniref:Uncharacterized protein n=1 Tax=Actinomadura rubrisoli TaxID=2530368 RepID=A0A4R5CCL2_9ACTN|nr:hypothetical protein [Actinomadura rubrisoli]TDD97195.1 hypothetical protein E1298_01800 [Actinomadura rubrisoli]